MKKVALVLSGGGFKGAFQVGALQYLKENWTKIDSVNNTMKFDVVAGVSVGSLNGVLVASNKFDQLLELWNRIANNGVEEIFTSAFIDTKSTADTVQFKIDFDTIKNLIPDVNIDQYSIWKKLGLIFSESKRRAFLNELLSTAKNDLTANFKALADNTPLKDKLTKLVSKSEIHDCIYKCGYVSLDDGNYYSFRHSDFPTDADLVNGILASTSMPIVWRPVPKVNTNTGQQKNSVDGGIRNVSPLGDVIDEINSDPGNEEYLIVIINCSSGEITPSNFENKNIAQIALRSLNDIAITEIFNDDLAEFIDKNYILEQVEAVLPGKDIYDYNFQRKQRGKILRHFKSIIIQPIGDTLGDTLVANKTLIDSRVAHGREMAEQALNQFISDGDTFKFTITGENTSQRP